MERAGRIDDVIRSVELEREVGNDPAILERIVDHHGITEIIGIAEVTKVALAHEGVDSEGCDADAGALVIDADRGVDGLDVIGWAYVTVRVGRMSCAPVGEVEAVEVRDG